MLPRTTGNELKFDLGRGEESFGRGDIASDSAGISTIGEGRENEVRWGVWRRVAVRPQSSYRTHQGCSVMCRTESHLLRRNIESDQGALSNSMV